MADKPLSVPASSGMDGVNEASVGVASAGANAVRAAGLMLAGLCLAGVIATSWNLETTLPLQALWKALAHPDLHNPDEILLAYSMAPRLVVSLLAGAALGLAGVLLQQVLRNPVASPTTLGLEAGGGLALAAALVWAPGLLAFGREWVALGGGVLAIALVLGLSWCSGFAPVVVILAGMVTSLFCAALAALLALFNTHYLAGLFLWGAGALSQQDWSAVSFLVPRLALAACAAVLLVRPLTVLGLDDASARSLGLSLLLVRVAVLLVAIVLTASVVAAVGSLGFIGLAAPALARVCGVRRIGPRLFVSALCGAGLLWVTDQAVQGLAGAFDDVLPTGAVTALFGAPLLLWMLPRLHLRPAVSSGLEAQAGGRLIHPLSSPLPWLAVLACALVLAVICSTLVGPGLEGWSLDWPPGGAGLGEAIWMLRLPRSLAAMSGGVMLALAGGILQRMTGNPMASPEVLGVSAGAACGLVLALFLLPAFGLVEQTAAASIGAFLALLVILAMGRSAQGGPERILLVGIAVGALLDAVVSILMASGDPRAVLLFNWMTGSTYGVGMQGALWSLMAALVLMALVPLLVRWLDLLPLGHGTAQALGLGVEHSRTVLLAFCAIATALATLLVGPLSFVGLIAPHLARFLGFRRPFAELAAAALLGGLIMVGADFIGRTLAFPWQLPAGLVASMVGAPAFLWLLTRKQAAS